MLPALFNVSSTGKLSKRAIEDNTQSDGRCGLKCQDCSWEVFGNDIEDDTLLEVIQNADEQWQDSSCPWSAPNLDQRRKA